MDGLTFEIAERNSYHMASREVHTEIEIYYLTKGERLYFVENKTYHLSAGSVLLISSNRIHKTSACGGEHHARMLLEVQPRFLQPFKAMFPRVSFDHLFSFSSVICDQGSVYNKEICQMFEYINTLMNEHPYGYEEEIRSLVFMIFLCFARIVLMGQEEKAVVNPKYQKIYEVSEYMSSNMGTITTLDEICNEFYISKYYLCHSFKEVTGMSVISFLNMIRIRRAKTLLCETKLSVAQIARNVGYVSVPRFSNMFKRSEGLSPSEYRRQMPGVW